MNEGAVARMIPWTGPSLDDDHADEIVYSIHSPFLLVHLGLSAALRTGVTAEALVLVRRPLYLLRIFAHRGGVSLLLCSPRLQDQPSRSVPALLLPGRRPRPSAGCCGAAAKHRRHHSHSDTERHVHSPAPAWLHPCRTLGLIFTLGTAATDYAVIADFARYPEPLMLDRDPDLPAARSASCARRSPAGRAWRSRFRPSTVPLRHSNLPAINSLAAHVAGACANRRPLSHSRSTGSSRT